MRGQTDEEQASFDPRTNFEVCPNCTVHYTPDPDVGEGRPVCPVCDTRKQFERIMGQFMALLNSKRDKKKNNVGRIIVPANGRFRH